LAFSTNTRSYLPEEAALMKAQSFDKELGAIKSGMPIIIPFNPPTI